VHLVSPAPARLLSRGLLPFSTFCAAIPFFCPGVPTPGRCRLLGLVTHLTVSVRPRLVPFVSPGQRS
jgi:hypothetical protein